MIHQPNNAQPVQIARTTPPVMAVIRLSRRKVVFHSNLAIVREISA